MNLLAYADESYLLDGNSDVIAVAGWLSCETRLDKFNTAWKKVLDSYGARHFHFREFVDKSHRNFKMTQYDGWDELKRENFLFDLALVACELGAPVGGCSFPDKTKREKQDSFLLKKHAYFLFFYNAVICTRIFETFDAQVDKIDFIFDENDDPNWFNALNEAFNEWKEQGRAPFSNWSQSNDKDCYALQAADLYVYAMRQNAERFLKNGMKPSHARVLDFILEKNRPDVNNWTFTKSKWVRLCVLVVNHYREWKKTNPDKKYYPLQHYPMLTPAND
jgi:hypothetical protein